MSLFVTTFCINVTHKVLTSELPIVKEQGSVNLIPFPASCLYESCGQQARPRVALALYVCVIHYSVITTKVAYTFTLIVPKGNMPIGPTVHQLVAVKKFSLVC